MAMPNSDEFRHRFGDGNQVRSGAGKDSRVLSAPHKTLGSVEPIGLAMRVEITSSLNCSKWLVLNTDQCWSLLPLVIM